MYDHVFNIFMKRSYWLFLGKRGKFHSEGLDVKEDTLPMQEQVRVPYSLGSSIRATDHLTCLLTNYLLFWKNNTPGYHSPTEHDLRSWRGSYCFTRGGSTLT